MFSLARVLPSSGSAEDRSSLFDRFTGAMTRSDSSGICRLSAGARRVANLPYKRTQC
jgi:hypothetical protein